jgi:hypothetical protein
LNTPNPGGLWACHWFFTGVITPDKFRGIDANPVDRREVSDERRQELLAQSARRRRLIRGMLEPGEDHRDYRVSMKSKTKPSKIRFD